jgi:hypothetical protein
MLTWPRVLVPASESWHLQNTSRSGGVSLTGSEQVVASGASRWRASLSIPISRDEQVLAWRALVAGLDGRAGTVLVGPTDARRAPWGTDAYGRVLSPSLYRRRHLDGTPFADPPDLAESLITATLAAEAAIRAASITIRVTQGSAPSPGNYLEIANRLHIVTAILGQSGQDTACQIRPGLRASAAAGAAVRLVSPKCEMRLASDETGDLELQLARFGTVAVELVEAF